MPQFTNDTPGDEVVKAYASRVPGKMILITGPSESGIGAQTAIFLATGKPALIVLAGRTKSKIQPVIDQIAIENPDVPIKFVELDLADLSSVRKAAEEVKTLTKKLDILVNNAGIMAIPNYTVSKDGIEYQFAANHIGHFLLTNLLMDEIIAAGTDSRIINVSSLGYLSGGVQFDDPNFNDGAEYNTWYAYAQSKTANILFTHALADKLKSKGVSSFALNPGLILESKLMANVSKEMFEEGFRITTEALNGEPMPSITPKSLAAGASTTLYGALDPDLKDHSGAFLDHAAISLLELRPHATGVENQEKLWELSEKLVGQKFSY
ncbi:hypothetical protein O988_02307 [Pseudogymnoascus sp. VKM F-3808]|nr:hypothetical protein O988_02307 [Pseudogymnoascus sp. VKM F-3808]